MNVLKRLRDIMEQKEMSEYRLSKESGVPQSTINSLFRKNNTPTVYTLEALCSALNISMSDFFYETSTSFIEDYEIKYLLSHWENLETQQKDLIIKLLEELNNK